MTDEELILTSWVGIQLQTFLQFERINFPRAKIQVDPKMAISGNGFSA